MASNNSHDASFGSTSISDTSSDKTTLYISHVPNELTHDDIRSLCSPYGNVVAVKRFTKFDTELDHLSYFVRYQSTRWVIPVESKINRNL